MDNIQGIGIEHDDDIIFCTVGKYKLFMSYGEVGMDAYSLYSHYMFTARLQETNQIWANGNYTRTGLRWGKARFNKANLLLSELGIIEKVPVKDDKGRFTKHYIRVKTQKTPFEIKEVQWSPNPPVDSSTSGFQTPNALTKKDKCFNEKEKLGDESPCSDVTTIRRHFEAINKEYYHDGKSAKQIQKLLRRKPLNDLFPVVDHFAAMCKERADIVFWRDTPVTPGGLLARYDIVIKDMQSHKSVADSYRIVNA